MNNWKALTISNEKYKRMILIAFLVIFYMIECGPISNLFYMLEDVFEEYNKNAHVSMGSGMYYAFKIFDAEEFMTFVYNAILDFICIAAPLVGAVAAYFGKKFYVYISEGVLAFYFILTLVGKGVYEDEYSWSDVTLSADTWLILLGLIFILVLLLADANVISFNQAPKQMNMNQPYGNYNQQPYGGYNQPQMNNQYQAYNPQMNNPYMAQNQMNPGYTPDNQMNPDYAANPQMDNPYAAPNQMYNGYDPNNGGN